MKRIGRREFLAGSLAGASGLLLGSTLTGCASKAVTVAKSKTFDPWEIVPLGNTGIKVTRVGFGTGMSGGRHSSNQVRLGKEKFEGLLKEAYDRGCRLFDFGRSKRGTGAFDFKKNWGFPPEPLFYQYIMRHGQEPPDINPLNPKFRIFVETWKRLPLPLANLLGPHIVRQLG